ncbi:hypothetical protein [Ruegeria arenilitoris]|uniref:hypothetical protein n=1 Tax=Ruegeria arenilitoris TaxID=1173585 RepID=UPI00147AF95E|nr:hypothetical protein [Ruegeria arenilitoris]
MTNKKGYVGAIRQVALKWPDFAAMERHGNRTDRSGRQRSIRDEAPLVWNTLDLKSAREVHMSNVAQQGQTAALHVLCQFPTELVKADEHGQYKMLIHAVQFVNKFHGGRAVFAARIDRDEAGRHVVDVFAMPTYERTYKDGRTAMRASVSKFTKAEAKRRFGRDDRRAQGSALQDAWFEYLRDELGIDVQRPERKKTTTKDRLEPEVYGLIQDREKIAADARKAARLVKGAERLAARSGHLFSRSANRLQKEIQDFVFDEER